MITLPPPRAAGTDSFRHKRAKAVVNPKLVKSIKLRLAEQTSDELRKMVEERDVDQYSDEAFVAAQELLDERTRGEAQEPAPKSPPPELSPEQRAAAEDALLRRQIRLIGVYYYFLASWCFLFGYVFFKIDRTHDFVGVAGILTAGFALLGWSLRRFYPFARVVVMLLSMLQIPAFPIGTIIGFYCFDKLSRADHLFGGKGHPGERAD
jgi:hypothetical protein